jgi:AraC family transcriptional regulator
MSHTARKLHLLCQSPRIPDHPAGPVPKVRLHTPSQLDLLRPAPRFHPRDRGRIGSPAICGTYFPDGGRTNPSEIIGLLSDELEAGGRSGTLYAETLAHALAIKLLQLNDTSEDKISSTQPLLPRILRRIQERIEAELNTQLSLHALAKESGYSRAHFLRVFRAATGLTPHQYVLEQRLHRALGTEGNSTGRYRCRLWIFQSNPHDR